MSKFTVENYTEEYECGEPGCCYEYRELAHVLKDGQTIFEGIYQSEVLSKLMEHLGHELEESY